MRMIRRMAVWAAAGGLMLAMGGAGRGAQGSGSGAGAQAQQTVVPGVVPVAPRDERTVSMEEEQAKMRNDRPAEAAGGGHGEAAGAGQ